MEQVIFKRGNLALDNYKAQHSRPTRIENSPATTAFGEECTALIVNSGKEAAKEIAHELSISIPGCMMVFAPTLATAQWILKRRRIDLVVSNAMLPDGKISLLGETLSQLDPSPTVVVVGDIHSDIESSLWGESFDFKMFRKINEIAEVNQQQQLNFKEDLGLMSHAALANRATQIKEIGADIRNDLNNPLQEIVALVFVAKAGGNVSPVTDQALVAIERAAHNMATVVNEIEGKIRQTQPH